VKLPKADKVLIQPRNRRLPAQRRASDNNGKAEFFESFGFRLDDWETLARAFRRAALDGEVIQHFETPHRVKYVLHAAMETPSGKSPLGADGLDC